MSTILLGVVVVLALAADNVASGVFGALPWSQLAPPLVIQAVLATMFGLSIDIARKAALERGVA